MVIILSSFQRRIVEQILQLFNDALLLADVRPIVCKARLEKGLNPDPVQAYVDSGYAEKIESERK